MLLRNIFERNSISLPSSGTSLAERFTWAKDIPPSQLVEVARRERIRSTDYIRRILIPKTIRERTPLATQVKQIHEAHISGREPLIIDPFETDDTHLRRLQRFGILGGRMRSVNFPVEVSINTPKIIQYLAPLSDDVPVLMYKLIQRAEVLFPYEGTNPRINKRTLYHYLSAINYSFALIHPYSDANGRTSEDIMYALWHRRPDLRRAIRYPSRDGERSGASVDQRNRIIHAGLQHIAINIAQQLNLPNPNKIRNYSQLKDAYATYYIGVFGTQLPESLWQRIYNNQVKREITEILDLLEAPSEAVLIGTGIVNQLAENLRLSSRRYKVKTRRGQLPRI